MTAITFVAGMLAGTVLALVIWAIQDRENS